MARFCSGCGKQLPDNANNCPGCGKPVGQSVGGGAAASPAATTSGGLADNVAGMLAYVTIIPAILFLVLEPYNRNKFIRFHAFQCIFLCVVLIVIHFALMMIPFIGWVISILVGLAALALWIVLLIKAYGGEMFKIPVIGDLAEKQANA